MAGEKAGLLGKRKIEIPDFFIGFSSENQLKEGVFCDF